MQPDMLQSRQRQDIGVAGRADDPRGDGTVCSSYPLRETRADIIEGDSGTEQSVQPRLRQRWQRHN